MALTKLPPILERLAPKLIVASKTQSFREARAGVAVIFNSADEKDDELRLLLMRRAERKSDHFSGQIAFPGGRVEPEDQTMEETAIRETKEEMGFNPGASNFLGYLGVYQTLTTGMGVVPCIFYSSKIPRISPNEEVQSYKWVSFQDLASEGSRSEYILDTGQETMSLPSFVIDDYVIWGLTERIISAMVKLVA